MKNELELSWFFHSTVRKHVCPPVSPLPRCSLSPDRRPNKHHRHQHDWDAFISFLSSSSPSYASSPSLNCHANQCSASSCLSLVFPAHLFSSARFFTMLHHSTDVECRLARPAMTNCDMEIQRTAVTPPRPHTNTINKIFIFFFGLRTTISTPLVAKPKGKHSLTSCFVELTPQGKKTKRPKKNTISSFFPFLAILRLFQQFQCCPRWGEYYVKSN